MTKSAASKKINATLSAIRSINGSETSEGVNRLIYERVRLSLISILAVRESLSFSELKLLLDTTDGNLAMHARKLEEAGLISCRKTHTDRQSKTEYSITKAGRKSLEAYLTHMEKLVNSLK